MGREQSTYYIIRGHDVPGAVERRQQGRGPEGHSGCAWEGPAEEMGFQQRASMRFPGGECKGPEVAQSFGEAGDTRDWN